MRDQIKGKHMEFFYDDEPEPRPPDGYISVDKAWKLQWFYGSNCLLVLIKMTIFTINPQN